MKILLTVHQFLPQFVGGTEVLTWSVARELITRGHEVHVLTGHPADEDLHRKEWFDEYEFEGIHVYRFNHSYTLREEQSSIVEFSYDNPLATANFAQILERFAPDVVHFFHLGRLGYGLIGCAVQAQIPAFMTPTDFWAICHTGQLVLENGSMCRGPSSFSGNCVKHFAQRSHPGPVGFAAERLPVAWADLLARLTLANRLPPYPYRAEVLAVASRLGKFIAQLNRLNGLVSPNGFMSEMLCRHGVLPRLITQSAFGIDVASGTTSCSRLTPHQPLRVGFVGTLARHKGCHILIEAFNALPTDRAVLNIYGNLEGYPEYAGKLRRIASDNRAIKFCGIFHNSKIREVLADLDVLVVPSLWFENTPLVLYSAQAARCPVVASNFPGISEVIRDEENGLLFEAGNVADLVRQLFRLIDNSDLVVRLSRNCRQPKSTATYVDELLNIWKAV